MYGIELLQNVVAAPARPSGPRPPATPQSPDRMRFDQVLRQVNRPKADARPAPDQAAPRARASQGGKGEAQELKAPLNSSQPEESAETDSEADVLAQGAGAQAALMALLLGPLLEQAASVLPEGSLGAGGTAAAPTVHVVEAVLAHLPAAMALLAEGNEDGSGQVAPLGEMAEALAQPTSTQLEAFVARAVDAPDTNPEAQPVESTFHQMVSMIRQAGGSDGQSSAMTDQEAQGELKAAPVKEEAPVISLASAPASQEVAPLGERVVEEVPLRPVEPEPVIRQVAQFARVILREGRSEAKLQLYPEHLGQIQIRLVVANGVVKANLQVTDQAVKAALDANLEQFKARMADQGLQVEQVQVSVGAENQFQGQGRGDQFPSQTGHTGGGDGRGAPDHGAAEEPQEQPQPQQGPSRAVGGRLNSLA